MIEQRVTLYLDSPDFPSVDALQMAMRSANYLAKVTARVRFRIWVRVSR